MGSTRVLDGFNRGCLEAEKGFTTGFIWGLLGCCRRCYRVLCGLLEGFWHACARNTR